MADKKYHPGHKYEIPHFLSPDTVHLCFYVKAGVFSLKLKISCSHVLFLIKNNQISWESTPKNISSF